MSCRTSAALRLGVDLIKYYVSLSLGESKEGRLTPALRSKAEWSSVVVSGLNYDE